MRWPFKVLGVLVLFFVLLSAFAIFRGYSNDISLDKYNQVKAGMFYAEVVSIIGKDGEEISRTNLPGVMKVIPPIETIMYQWKNSNGSNMNLMFQNNSLISKAQFGLK